MAEKLFNDGWSFMLKNVGSELPDAVSEECWHDVEIPHDWLIGDTSDLYRSNDGWYKKTFFIEELSENDVYILRFDGVYMNSTVYVNANEAGYNRYGYSTFSEDITGYLKKGANDIYVRVRYESPNTRWYSGAGIFRNVYLRKTNKLHIKENGIYISSRKYDGDNKWIVIIETESRGDCSVRHRVLDSLGRKCAEVSAEQKNGFSRSAFYAVNPVLWDTDSPVTYEMISDVISSDGEILDSVSNIFGFRTVEFDPDRGFILNDRKVKLHGVCMHHDLGALGSAFNEAALRRQLKILRSFGVNAIRTSHNMPARELISMCCEMGILVDDESFDMWELPKNENDYSRFFSDNYEKDVKSWITRDRNAPCVIMWSIGNEIYDTHVSPHGLEIAKKLCNAVHKYDRYGNAACTIASNYMKWENAQNVADHLKLAGYNYAEDLYGGHHEAFPD
ncbi:MAG: beta-galactosidase, partial [Ruminiclostridium sp.]|nr:beta-galactosidase [Ruminiclostridium sp.]